MRILRVESEDGDKEHTHNLGFYNPNLCFQIFVPEYVAIGRRDGAGGGGGFIKIRVLAVLFFPATFSPSQAAERLN